MLADQKTVRIDMSPNAAIRNYLSGSKPRMHSFEAMWCISCSRFKHCAVVPDSSCRPRPVLDDDASAKTRLARYHLQARAHRAAELLLAEAAVAEFSKQIELALFMEAKLDVAAS